MPRNKGWLWETGKTDLSKHFGVHVCGERGRSGLALLRWCHVLHPPSLRSCIPALLWLPITGTAEAMGHTQALKPQLSPRVARGPQVPARGRAKESQGVFKAKHVANMSWPYLLLEFLTAKNYWNPGAGNRMYPFLSFLSFSLSTSSNSLFLEFLRNLILNGLTVCEAEWVKLVLLKCSTLIQCCTKPRQSSLGFLRCQ